MLRRRLILLRESHFMRLILVTLTPSSYVLENLAVCSTGFLVFEWIIYWPFHLRRLNHILSVRMLCICDIGYKAYLMLLGTASLGPEGEGGKLWFDRPGRTAYLKPTLTQVSWTVTWLCTAQATWELSMLGKAETITLMDSVVTRYFSVYAHAYCSSYPGDCLRDRREGMPLSFCFEIISLSVEQGADKIKTSLTSIVWLKTGGMHLE